MGVKGIYYIKLKSTKIIQFLNIFLLSKFLMFKIIKISESPKIVFKVEYAGGKIFSTPKLTG